MTLFDERTYGLLYRNFTVMASGTMAPTLFNPYDYVVAER